MPTETRVTPAGRPATPTGRGSGGALQAARSRHGPRPEPAAAPGPGLSDPVRTVPGMTVISWVADEAAGEQRMELVEVRTTADGVTARGTALVGAGELTAAAGPFTLAYELETWPDLTTRRLAVRTRGDGWARSVQLTRDGGRWTLHREAAPEDGLTSVDPAELAGALDCDLVSSALFNMMPVARTGLHRTPGRQEFLMAWVDVPSLTVTASHQVYGHVRPGVVSFDSEGGFTAEIEMDDEGYALRYPMVALRV